MRKLSMILALGLTGSVLASTTTNLLNENNYNVGRGDLETQFSINPEFFRGDVKDERFSLNLGGNYFIDDIFAPGAEMTVVDTGAGTDFRFIPNLKAYWPLHSRVLPYAQVGLGFAHVPGSSGFAFGLGAGVNYLLSSSVAVGVKLAYEVVAGDFVVHEVSLPIGFAIYFRI